MPREGKVINLTLSSRNVTITGRRTSLRLEDEIWDGLDEICQRENLTLAELCAIIENRRDDKSRTSAVRVFALSYFRAAATAGSHEAAGHNLLGKKRA